MRTAKAGRLEHALDEILAVLQQYGEVTISANVAGRNVSIRLEDADGSVATTGRRGGRVAVAAKSADGRLADNAPDAEQVFAAISDIPIGLTLEDLANKLKASSIDVDRVMLTRGLNDVLLGGKMAMTDDEVRNTLMELSKGL